MNYSCLVLALLEDAKCHETYFAAYSSGEHRVGGARVGAEQLVGPVAVREHVRRDRRLLDHVAIPSAALHGYRMLSRCATGHCTVRVFSFQCQRSSVTPQRDSSPSTPRAQFIFLVVMREQRVRILSWFGVGSGAGGSIGGNVRSMT